MISFQNAAGRTIYIDSILVERIYGGVLEGLPTAEESVRSFRERLVRVWGERATHLVVPSPLPARLPEYRVAAWLDSAALNDGCGSGLVVGWFAESPVVPEDVGRVVGGLDWSALAADWWP